MCLIYPEAWTDATEEIGMRAFFDVLENVEMVMQCRYQALKILHAATVTAQMVESCRLAAGAMAREVRSTHVNMIDVPGPSRSTRRL